MLHIGAFRGADNAIRGNRMRSQQGNSAARNRTNTSDEDVARTVFEFLRVFGLDLHLVAARLPNHAHAFAREIIRLLRHTENLRCKEQRAMRKLIFTETSKGSKKNAPCDSSASAGPSLRTSP